MLATVLRGAALTALLASALAAVPLRASQLTVGPAGSGAQFTEISAAVAAAQPGDRVLVAPGTYGAFLVDKAVTVVGAGNQYVIVDQGAGVAGLRVVGLAANEAAHVSGLTVSAGAGVATPFPHVEVAQNAGRVVLSHVHAGTLEWFTSSGVTSGPTAAITDSDAVLLDGCHFHGFTALPAPPSLSGESALHVTGSSVWIADTHLLGANGVDGPGAPALVATDSDVSMARCQVIGGWGGDFCGWELTMCTEGWGGAEGISLVSSRLVLAGGPGNRVRGGSGALVMPSLFTFLSFPGGPGVGLHGASTVRAAADANVAYGFDGDDSLQPGCYAGGASGALVEETYALPTADFLPTLAAPGDSVALSVSGAADATQIAFWSPILGPPTALAGFTESLALPIAGLNLLAVLSTAGDGLGSYLTDVPLWSGFAGARLVAQTVELGPNGLLLSNPTTLAVR